VLSLRIALSRPMVAWAVLCARNLPATGSFLGYSSQEIMSDSTWCLEAGSPAHPDETTSGSSPEANRSLPTLRANFAWTLAGNAVYAGCQWGMLSVLAKLGSPSIVGQFTLGLAICAPVFMFTNLQLRAVQATDMSADSDFGNYFTLRLLATMIGLLFLAAMLPVACASAPVHIVLLLVAVSKCFECMSDVTAGLLQREEQLKKVAISLIIRGLTSVVVFTLSFAVWRSLAASLMAMTGVWIAVLWLYDIPNARQLTGRKEPLICFNHRKLRRLAMLGLPLGWVATLSSLNTNIPRYFLQHHLGLADQGIFASLAYFVVVINLVVFALTQSVTTRLARQFAEGDRKGFVRLLLRLCALGGVIVIAGVPGSLLLGRRLLTLVYRREYAEHVGLLADMVGVTGILTIAYFVTAALTSARRFSVQLPVAIASTVTILISCPVLVPRFGIEGAGVALLLSAIVSASGSVLALYATMRGGVRGVHRNPATNAIPPSSGMCEEHPDSRVRGI
jgi:O-antigen/teichoic acid export membrane protein